MPAMAPAGNLLGAGSGAGVSEAVGTEDVEDADDADDVDDVEDVDDVDDAVVAVLEEVTPVSRTMT